MFTQLYRWRNSWRKLPGVLLVTGVALMGAGSAQADRAAQTGFYLDAYGPADPTTTPQAQRAQSIFRELRRLAGPSVASAKLILVNSPGHPWAVALADGNIVLSAASLEVIYAGRSEAIGDARLAFVLGHELAHLANRDLWHHQVYASIAGNTGQHSLQRVREALMRSATDLAEIRERELKADEVGFFYASLAGYATGSIIEDTTGTSFLADWVEKTQAWIDDEHHTPEERTAFLATRLGSIRNEVSLFDYGVRLAHFGRYEDALVFLDAFRHRYPSRQVLSNIGYVHIQLARQSMPPGLAYRFWYPTLLEAQSGVPELPRNWRNELSTDVIDHLEQAVMSLEEAARLDASDIVSRMNLVVAQLYLGEVFKARAVIEEALALWPDNTQLLALRALVLLDQEPQVDMWKHVTEQLESLVGDGTHAPDNLIYNLARLYADRGRHGQATDYWQILLARLAQLPANYQRIVCAETAHPAECRNADNASPAQDAALQRWLSQRFAMPVVLGSDVDDRSVRKALSDWRQDEWTIGTLNARVFSNQGGDSVLALDHHAELAVVASGRLPTPGALRLEHGEPDVVMPLGSGTVWAYGSRFSAVVRDDRLVELWIARQ